ncbi:DUF4145 domain-containing protein [Clostridium autoethanogenum]|uniref:DUF4145 domain-containing protein n=1 Tax=Clostridium autoethanogenum TaxID=84023 RepID=A0A3M0SZR0_9CLOT|nr:DUF4145 domain-containing protein [Clostridium autoethanogenum]RMD03211.1 DUF4145 domain-containing protein [Clostridium autoethanogenum]
MTEILKNNNINYRIDTLNEKLKLIRKEKFINPKEIDVLEELRVFGNDAIHEGEAAKYDAKRLLKELQGMLSNWISKRYVE